MENQVRQMGNALKEEHIGSCKTTTKETQREFLHLQSYKEKNSIPLH